MVEREKKHVCVCVWRTLRGISLTRGVKGIPARGTDPTGKVPTEITWVCRNYLFVGDWFP